MDCRHFVLFWHCSVTFIDRFLTHFSSRCEGKGYLTLVEWFSYSRKIGINYHEVVIAFTGFSLVPVVFLSHKKMLIKIVHIV